MVFIRGCVHPPLKNVKKYDYFFVKSEEKDVLKRFIGVPVYFEHMAIKRIGTVVDVNLGYNKEIIVDIHIPMKKNDRLITSVIAEVYATSLKYLSIKYDTKYLPHNKQRVGDFTPLEISLVYSPGIDHTRITHYGNSQILHFSDSGITEVSKNMTELNAEEKEEMTTCAQVANTSTPEFLEIMNNKEYLQKLVEREMEKKNRDLEELIRYNKTMNADNPDFRFTDEEYKKDYLSTLPSIAIGASVLSNFKVVNAENTRLKPFEVENVRLKQENDDLKKKFENAQRVNSTSITTETGRRNPGQENFQKNMSVLSDIFNKATQTKVEKLMPGTYREVYQEDKKMKQTDEAKF